MMAWKGWLGVATHYSQHGGSPHRRVYVDNPVGDPVIVTPIEDESLPHPGDGRIWETRPKSKVVDVVAADGEFLWVRYGAEDRGFLCRPSDLRERKPEPEHTVWCWNTLQAKGCTCERRSGEDRRQGERRETKGVTWRFVGGRRPNPYEGGYGDLLLGRRSGTDRRSS